VRLWQRLGEGEIFRKQEECEQNSFTDMFYRTILLVAVQDAKMVRGLH
jgi:hypothetical protein